MVDEPTTAEGTESTEQTRPDRVPSRSWARRLLQFRLRTLMLMTVAAALATQWWLRPRPEEFPFGDYRVFKHVRLEPFTPGGGMSAGGGSGRAFGVGDVEVELLDGAFWICDRDGRLLVRGAFEENVPTGRWRAYHPNGRLAMSGRCNERGGRAGLWKSWHENGQPRTRIEYGPSREVDDWQTYNDVRISVRQGPAQAWHDNGQLHWSGQFDGDRQHGRWSFYSDQGELVAEGDYRKGRRHGAWRIRQPSGQLGKTHYLAGQVSQDPDAVTDAQLREMIADHDHRSQLDALQLAFHSRRWKLLGEAARSADARVARAALDWIARDGAAANSLGLDLAKLADDRSDPRVSAAALAVRFAVESEHREQIIQRITSSDSTAEQRLELAAALTRQGAIDPNLWAEQLRRPQLAVSRFALQVLLWNWSQMHPHYGWRPQPESSAQISQQIMIDALRDEQVPEPVRQMLQAWADATMMGKSGGFGFGWGGFGGSIF